MTNLQDGETMLDWNGVTESCSPDTTFPMLQAQDPCPAVLSSSNDAPDYRNVQNSPMIPSLQRGINAFLLNGPGAAGSTIPSASASFSMALPSCPHNHQVMANMEVSEKLGQTLMSSTMFAAASDGLSTEHHQQLYQRLDSDVGATD